MEHEKTALPLSIRSGISGKPLLESLLKVLDAIDTSVLIVNQAGDICFFNQDYYDQYADLFQKAGIPADQILGSSIYKKKNPQGTRVMQALTSKQPVFREFFIESDSSYYGLTNLLPIEIDGFDGIAVIMQESHNLKMLSKEIAHYRELSLQLQQQLTGKDTLPQTFQDIIGEAPVFVKAMKTAAQVASASSSVCILGESGTGKEVFAEAIHYSSPFSKGPLIKVNCAAIPESLIESELFGYEKGAFTGANTKGKPGKFELANNGTLFLDEIGEMPLSMQAKLLRALQEREIVRVGGSTPIKLNFRLISATNRNLEEMVKEGTFREDLYYRICIIPLQLPALRHRKADIPLLANYFLQQLSIPGWEKRSFSSEVMEQFTNYNWPGNIRELKNCVERMAVLCTEEEINTEVLPTAIANATGHIESQDVIADLDAYNLHDIISKVEYDTIKSVLNITKGNKAKAIEILGISKRNFYMKLEKYGLK